MRTVFFICLAVLTVQLEAAPARAQDWGAKRDPFDRGTIRRYKALLAKNPHDGGALARLSSLYRKHRSLAKLIGEYEDTIRGGDQYAPLVVLGHLAASKQDSDAAIGYFERALRLKPKDLTTSNLLGELHERGGDFERARAVFVSSLKLARGKNEQKSILHKLARLSESAGDADGTEGYLRRYLELAPGDTQVRLGLADALIKNGNHAKAIDELRAAERNLARDPVRRVEVIARLGDALDSSGDGSKAVIEYRRALELASRNSYMRKELTYRIIEIFRRRQELVELAEHYEKKWPRNQRSHFEWDVMARLYEEVGNQEKALAAYREATRRGPGELDTHRRLIRLLETSGREEDALKQYLAVIRIAPGEPRFQLELAERYFRRNQKPSARRLLARLESRFSGDAGVQAAVADLYTRWGEEELAIKTHLRLTRIEPQEVIHLENLGEQYFQRGDKKKALAVWKRIIANKSPENLARLGKIYSEHDMAAPALDMYSKAIKKAPKDANLYRGRATVFEREKDWRKAASDWQRVYDLTDSSPGSKATRSEARRRIVSLLHRAGRRSLRSRMAGWHQAFATGTTDAGYFLVAAYLRTGQPGEARKVLTELTKLSPEDDEALALLANVYKQEQSYEKAIEVLLELAKRHPARETEYFNQVAELKTRLNRDSEALFYARKALSKSPKDPGAYEQLAQRYLQMQQYDNAITALTKTIELAPRNFEAYFTLARLYRNTHRLSEASDLYRQVLRRSTDDEVIRKAGSAAIDLEEITGSLGELERVLSPLAFTFAHKIIYRRILVELYDRYVPSLVAKARNGTDNEHDLAVEELHRIGKRGLKPLLEALADDVDLRQRQIAVATLGYLGNAGAAAPLVQLAKQPRPAAQPFAAGQRLDWDLRIRALVAAGRLADPRAIPSLVSLASDEEVAMREAAVFALGMTRDRKAQAALLAALKDSRTSVRALACIGLGKSGDQRALPQVTALAASERENDSVRAACAYALGLSNRQSVIPTLAELVTGGNDEVHRLAAWSLGYLRAKEAIPSLIDAYFGKRAAVRKTVAWAIQSASSDAPMSPSKESFMSYPMRGGKLDLTRAVADLPGTLPPAKPAQGFVSTYEKELARAIHGALTRHRDLVHRVLMELDGAPGTLSLGPLAPNTSSDREQSSLARIGAALGEDLAELSRHSDPVVRKLALSLLAKTGGSETIDLLSKSLEAESLEHRIAAMEAIAPAMRRNDRGTQRLSALVLQRLAGEDWREQVAAAAAMGTYGAGADVTTLIQVAGDSSRKSLVRQAAIRSLGALGANAAIPTLEKASRDRARAVQEQAVLALRALPGGASRAALRRIARDRRVSTSARALARDSTATNR